MDSDEGSSQELVFGDGDLPPSLERVNWAAFFLGGLWALVHGLWTWFAAILVLRFGLLALGIVARRAGLFDAGIPELAFSLFAGLLSWSVYTIFALKANGLAWDKARSRLSRRSDEVSGSQTTLGAYSRNQKTLLVLGIALFVLGTLLSVQAVVQGTTTVVPLLLSLAAMALGAGFAQLLDVGRRGRRRSS